MIVLLDQATLPDIDLQPFNKLQLSQPYAVQCYAQTAAEQVLQRLAGAKVALVNKVVLNASTLAQLPELQLICVLATGVNNVDVAAATRLGMTVCNARDYASHAVPQHAMALLLALMNQIPAYQQAVQQGAWSRSAQFCYLGFPIRQLSGLTFVVLGYGGLGQATARLAEAFGMQLVIAERPGRSEIRAGRVSFTEALQRADVLSLHCPATPDNARLLNAETLRLLKPQAVIVNTARGSLIDSAALATALRRGELAGAALDVLDIEPPPADHPLLQADIPNLIISPHVGWASREAMQTLVLQAAENIDAFYRGSPIRTC